MAKFVPQPELPVSEQAQIRRDKLAALQAEGRDPFAQVRFDRTSNSQEILNNFETMENQTVAIAGRIMSKRDMGKASFCHIQDQQGRIQIFVARDNIGQDEYNILAKLLMKDSGLLHCIFKYFLLWKDKVQLADLNEPEKMMAINLFMDTKYSKELGATEDDIKAAIFDSIKVSQASYDGKVKLLEMKGE